MTLKLVVRDDNKCQQPVLGHDHYVPCNEPAAFILWWKDEHHPPIRVCTECAEYNVNHCGGIIVAPFVDLEEP